MPHARLALVGVNALLVGLIAAGCNDDPGRGGDGDRRSDGTDQTEGAYTVDEMCQEFEDRLDSGESDDFDAGRSYILDLHRRGLPQKAPADAVEGLEIMATLLKDADSEQDANDAADKLSADERRSVGEFSSYLVEECGSESPSHTVPTDLGTDLPSDLPTDVPSFDPSDLPSDVESMFPSGVPSELQSMVPTQ